VASAKFWSLQEQNKSMLKNVLSTLRLGGILLSRQVSLGVLLAAFMTIMSMSASAQPVTNRGMDSLEKFISETRSGRADFVQTVTSPARTGEAPRVKTSTGTFEFSRPNRFRFFYQKPFEQTIVADGETLWLHDVDLNQVTARRLAQVLNGTPAAVIAAAASLKGLQADFSLSPLPENAGLQWVMATPKSRDGQVKNISVGFRVTAQGSALASLDILDSFGQRSVMTFSRFEANPIFSASHFQFKPPAGADVLRQ
jgi:outer membrane lipoprotein carrier protein